MKKRYLKAVVAASLVAQAVAASAQTNREYQAQAGGRSATQATQSAIVNSVSSFGSAGMFRIRLGDSGDTESPARPALSLTQRGAAASGDSDSPWTLWATPVLNNVSNRISPITSKGNVNLLLLGLEHNQDDELIRGVIVAFDQADITTPYNSGIVKGNGYTLSPYLAMPFSDTWILDASVGVGRNELKTNVSGTTATPSSDRSLAAIGVTHNHMTKTKWLISFKAGYSYARDEIGSYTDSSAASTAASSSTLSQIRVGVNSSYTGSKYKPFIGVYQHFNDFTVSGGSATKPREYSSTPQLQLGLSPSSGPWYASLVSVTERGRSAIRFYVGYRY
jgi:hypothetical protein